MSDRETEYLFGRDLNIPLGKFALGEFWLGDRESPSHVVNDARQRVLKYVFYHARAMPLFVVCWCCFGRVGALLCWGKRLPKKHQTYPFGAWGVQASWTWVCLFWATLLLVGFYGETRRNATILGVP